MKIAVVGSREFPDRGFVESKVVEWLTLNDNPELISGGANGVDTWAECVADNLQIKKSIYHAHWSKYGIKAGYMRNVDIVKNSDMVLAFWDGKSKGTKHSIDLAIKAGKPLNIYVRR